MHDGINEARKAAGRRGEKTGPVPARSRAAPPVLLAVLAAAVVTAVLAAHWPALNCRAVSFDDDQYILNNKLVQNPGWSSARQFLGEILEPSTVRGYYQPLAMISLMADYALGGRNDNLRPFHRSSLLLHAANTVLLIVWLYLLFGRPWPAALAGLLFGVHPLTVEPIPWLGERKTLLAAFFAFCALICYVNYARRGGWGRYAGCMLFYILALMSKPTSTPLPLVFLIMDYWPLRRFGPKAVLEKIPFLVFGGVSAIITCVSQARTLDVVVPGEYPPGRIPLVLCHNIIFYLYKTICPINLSSHYPFPQPLDCTNTMIRIGVVGTGLLIGALLISFRFTPALLAGGLAWFAAILPSMQIIGFSDVIASDKFMYLPAVGFLMIVGYYLGRLWGDMPGEAAPKAVRAGRIAAVVIVLALAAAEFRATRNYLAYWQDTERLNRHMLSIAPRAAPVHYNLGYYLHQNHRTAEAEYQYRQALDCDPRHAMAHNNLAVLLAETGDIEQAIKHYRAALAINPRYAKAHNNLAQLLVLQRKIGEAVEHFQAAVALQPDYINARYNLAVALLIQGQTDEAVTQFRKVLARDPNNAKFQEGLQAALREQQQKP